MSQTAFTVGKKDLYDQFMDEHPEDAKKLGKTDEYPGGWVFPDHREAKKCADFLTKGGHAQFGLPEGKYGVYQIHLPHSWEEDTYIPEGQSIPHLITSALITRKIY